MRRFILTGAPGAGKTAILRGLEAAGQAVVEEAATDVIALESARGVDHPHAAAAFIEAIVDLQRRRRERADGGGDAVQIHDRCAICTLALARFLGRDVPTALAAELARIEAGRIYERRVFFVESLGFITPSQARRISLEDAARFGLVHQQTYRELGYELVAIAAASVDERVAAVTALLA